jgi:acid stress-induced BolA-like protein IbaG/YrbA
MMAPDEVKTILEKALPDSMVEVQDMTGGGDHFQVFVVSPSFEGKGLVDQHQIVYGALKEAMGSERIHALALKTFTPEQWKRFGS